MLGSARADDPQSPLHRAAGRRSDVRLVRRRGRRRARSRAARERVVGRQRAAARDVREPGEDAARPRSTSSCGSSRAARRRPHGPVTARLSGPFAEPGRRQAAEVRLHAPSCRPPGRPSTRARPTTGAKALRHADGHAVRGLRSRDAGSSSPATSSRSRAASARRAAWCWAASASTSRSGCRTPRNEGEAQVGDAKTIKITGAADVKQVIADLDKITEKASALNVPGASGELPQKLTRAAEAPRPRTRSRRSTSTSTPAPTTRSCAG